MFDVGRSAGGVFARRRECDACLLPSREHPKRGRAVIDGPLVWLLVPLFNCEYSTSGEPCRVRVQGDVRASHPVEALDARQANDSGCIAYISQLAS